MLRSDVICSSCGHASTTQDPFTHLSLDIPPREQLIPLPILPRPAAHAGGSKAVGAGSAAGKGGGTAPKVSIAGTCCSAGAVPLPNPARKVLSPRVCNLPP